MKKLLSSTSRFSSTPRVRLAPSARCLALSLSALLVLVACSPGGDAGSANEGSGGAESTAPAAGSGSAAAPASAGESEAPSQLEGAPPAAGSPGGEAAERAQDNTPEPPRLPMVMARIGFDDPEVLQLAEFVPVPPGATGEAGVFGRGDEQVRVALMRYTNDRFAGPHVRDIHERRRVLPNAGEAVAHAGRFVIHVVAADRDTADSVAESLRQALRWPADL